MRRAGCRLVRASTAARTAPLSETRSLVALAPGPPPTGRGVRCTPPCGCKARHSAHNGKRDGSLALPVGRKWEPLVASRLPVRIHIEKFKQGGSETLSLSLSLSRMALRYDRRMRACKTMQISGCLHYTGRESHSPNNMSRSVLC